MASPNFSQTQVFASMTALMATALDNGSGEHGPFGLSVPSLPLDLVKALLEVGVKDLPDRGFCKTFQSMPLMNIRGIGNVLSLTCSLGSVCLRRP